MKRVCGFLSLGVILFFVNGFAQDRDPYRLKAEAVPPYVPAGGKGTIVVTCAVDSGFHIGDKAAGLFDVVPDPKQGIRFSTPEFPKGETSKYGSFYRGTVRVSVPFAVDSDFPPGNVVASLAMTVQPCSEDQAVCYPPETRKVEAVFEVSGEKAPMTSMPDSESKGMAGRLTGALQKGSWVAFLLVFLGGLLTSFTPCVYPMIPITIAVIGAQASGSKFRGFVLSLFYVLGIAATFSILGAVAAKTGALFGSLSQHPVVIGLLALVFFAMGLSMAGVFVLQMPPSIASKLRTKKGKGFFGAFLTGMIAGIVVSPCISPLLVVILSWVAQTGSVLLGVGLLFCYALGLGILLIAIGTFSGFLKALPKSGFWMEWIEKGFGILLMGLALVFLKPLLGVALSRWVWASFLLVVGTFIGAFKSLDAKSPWHEKTSKALGLAAVMVAASLIFWGLRPDVGDGSVRQETVIQTGQTDVSWMMSESDAFQAARKTGKGLVIDFFAEWCPACRELDEKTWPDPGVRSEMESWIPLKLDLTKNDDQTKETMKKYKILGMPTVLFLTSDGKEIKRLEGFHPAEEMVQILQQGKN